jgi:hypothetical protein
VRISHQRPNYLFNKHELYALLEGQIHVMQDEVAKYPANELLNTGTERLLDYFQDKYSIELPVLHEDERRLRQTETQVDVRYDPNRFVLDTSRPVLIPGTRYEIIVPFTGEEIFFHCKASTFSTMHPVAEIKNGAVIFTYDRTDHNPDAIKAAYESDLSNVKKYLEWVVRDAGGFNGALRGQVREAIEARRKKLLADQGVAASLGIPLERDDAPKTYAAPDIQRRLPVVRPVTSSKPYTPEPTLEMADYEHILGVMKAMSSVIERNAGTFASSTEPQIRDHFLVQLNGHYKGQATGETFNAAGKTDILVRSGDKNIFIAECKFWDGPKTLSEALTQLLGYSTWRDSKLALVILNRGRNFTDVLGKVPETLDRHPSVVKRLGYNSESDFRYLLRHPDDPDKELYLTVMCFEVPGSRKVKA